MNNSVIFYPITIFYSRIVLNKISPEQRIQYRNVEKDFKKLKKLKTVKKGLFLHLIRGPTDDVPHNKSLKA